MKQGKGHWKGTQRFNSLRRSTCRSCSRCWKNICKNVLVSSIAVEGNWSTSLSEIVVYWEWIRFAFSIWKSSRSTDESTIQLNWPSMISMDRRTEANFRLFWDDIANDRRSTTAHHMLCLHMVTHSLCHASDDSSFRRRCLVVERINGKSWRGR